MGMTGLFRCENGQVLEMDLPLPDAFAARLKRGEIVRVADLDGTPWEPPAEQATTAGPSEAELLARDLDDARAELDLATRQRDDLAAELAQARQELAAVTAERDALAAELAQAKPARGVKRPSE